MSEHHLNARMAALTDGVMSIAMTLLVLDIQLPDAVAAHVTWRDLRGIGEHFYAYALSFMVVALFWLGHARRVRALNGYTPTLFWLNNLFLLFVGLTPFSTSLLAASGNQVATIVYSTSMFAASVCLTLMSVHVTAEGLAHPEGQKTPMRPVHLLRFVTAAIFGLSALLAFWRTDAARAVFLLLVVVAVIPDRWMEAAED